MTVGEHLDRIGRALALLRKIGITHGLPPDLPDEALESLAVLRETIPSQPLAPVTTEERQNRQQLLGERSSAPISSSRGVQP